MLTIYKYQPQLSITLYLFTNKLLKQSGGNVKIWYDETSNISDSWPSKIHSNIHSILCRLSCRSREHQNVPLQVCLHLCCCWRSAICRQNSQVKWTVNENTDHTTLNRHLTSWSFTQIQHAQHAVKRKKHHITSCAGCNKYTLFLDVTS